MGATRTVSVALKMQVADFIAGSSKAAAATKGMARDFDQMAKTHKEKFNDISKVSLGVGGALLAVAGYAVKASYEFDKQMSEVAAVATKDVPDAMGKLRDAAIEAGKATVFSATDAAKAEAELAKAGISTSDILSGGLKGALSLASAGQMDLADAATISAQAMNIFGLHGKDVTHIADVLASAANVSAADMQGLGDSLKQGGLVAAQTGLSLEDTVGTLAAFADHALVGADAGTSLKAMLQALQAPSTKTKDLMDQLGISAYDTSGKFIGITALAGQLQDKLGGLTQAERDNALAQIFGSDAARAASILYREGSKNIAEYTAKVNESGAASKTSATKMNNLAGDVEQLKGSFETLAIESSGGVTKGLRVVTEAATGLVNVLVDLPTPVTATATVLSLLGGGALLGVTGFVKLTQTAHAAADALKGMGETGPKVLGFLTSIGRSAGPVGLAAVAIGSVFTAISFMTREAPKFKPAARDVDALTASLKALAQTGQVSGYLAQTMGADLKTLAIDLQQVGVSAKSIDRNGGAFAIAQLQEQLDNAATQGVADAKKISDALVNILNTSGASTANLAFDDVSKRLQAMNVPLSQVNSLMSGYLDAAANVSLANSSAAKGFANAGQKVDILSRSLETAISQGETFESLWKEINGGLLNTQEAELSAKKSIDNVTETLKKNHNAWKGNSEAALEDQVAVGQAAESAAKAAQAKYEETGSVSAANKVYDSYIGQLRKSMLRAGLSKTAVDKLLAAYSKMPDSVTTSIHTPGLGKAIHQADGFWAKLQKINGTTVSAHVITHFGTTGGSFAERYGGLYEHAAVGKLREASTYSPANPGRYMIAEPETGGEAFVPKYGDYGRSMSILGQAAAWYGARVVPGGWGGQQGRVEIGLNGDGAMREFVRLFAVQVQAMGGLQVVFRK